ncbi:MAG: triple tyrosine motif-containing protein [Breznakibacter sp.]
MEPTTASLHVQRSRTSLGILLKVAFITMALFKSATDGRCNGPVTGTPPIMHYTHADYNGDSQFWAVCQGPSGIMYFGNNDGALAFDGEQWNKVFLPNNSSVRSLLCTATGEIYAGGFNEFGRIERNAVGQYHYVSLTHLLRIEDRNFENIWQIHDVNGTVVLRSFHMLIAIQNQKASIIKTSSSFLYSEVHNGLLYFLDANGIQSLNVEDMAITPMLDKSTYAHEDFLTLIPTKTKHLYYLLTKQGSVYQWELGKAKAQLLQRILPTGSSNLVTCAIQASNGEIYTGSLSDKMRKWNADGLKWTLAGTFPDLQDQTVLNLFEGREGNIWVLLNKGLDCFDSFSPVTTLFKDASVFDVLPVGNKLYIATNQGVFTSENTSGDNRYAQNDFAKINGLEGQTWSLQQIGDEIVCSHDRGLFIISGHGHETIHGITGVWKLYPVKEKAGYYFACTYNGLFLLEHTKGSGFRLRHKVEGFDESGRDIMSSGQKNVYWVCHGYKGVFRIKLDNEFSRVVSLEHFTDQNGLPSAFNINVHNWANQQVFTSNHGIFNFDERTETFIPNSFLNQLLGTGKNVRKILTRGRTTWVVIDDEVAYFRNDTQNPVLVHAPFLGIKSTLNRGMECIVPVNDSNALIGTTSALFAYQLQPQNQKQLPQLLFSSVTYTYKSLVVALPVDQSGHTAEIPHNTYNIKLNFSAPTFRDKANVQYSYLLDGDGNQWSDWQTDAYKSFTHLQSGKYTIRVKARSLSGEQATEAMYKFEVQPVWYRTTLALIAWLGIAVFLVWWLVRRVQKTIAHEKEKTRQEEKKLQKVLELELEQLRLEREKQLILQDKDKLEEDVIHKSKELVNYTMLLAKKRELLIEMQDELAELKLKARNDVVRSRLQSLSRRIEVNLNDEQYLQLFETNFERVHQHFFNELKNRFPQISQKELQLCAFIKMELTNKEIASILNISVRGVETARYRLKKSLGMEGDEHIAALLEKIGQSGK